MIKNYQVGAEPIKFEESYINTEEEPLKKVFLKIDPESFYIKDILYPAGYKMMPEDFIKPAIIMIK